MGLYWYCVPRWLKKFNIVNIIKYFLVPLKHLAQCLAHSNRSINISCHCYNLERGHEEQKSNVYERCLRNRVAPREPQLLGSHCNSAEVRRFATAGPRERDWSPLFMKTLISAHLQARRGTGARLTQVWCREQRGAWTTLWHDMAGGRFGAGLAHEAARCTDTAH